MKRTHLNGKINEKNIGQVVTIIGWVHKRRNLGSIVFIDLRDRSGIVQVLVKNDKINVDEIRSEFIISVTGTVLKKDVPNPKLKTGAIEIMANDVTIINRAITTPIIIDDECDALEDTRLKYRYLDLRRPIVQEKLITRAKIVKATHEYLDANDFIEIETPILTLSTPEGARDYLVPSRIHHGSFYALPQSPQLFKQLLMIGGMERYYQIAKCFRDEDLRADRQPDFTQIDIETSFLDQDEFLGLMEGLLYKIIKDVKNREIQLPLRRLSYDEAVNTYGSDKPDTRFGLLIHDVKQIFGNSSFEGFKLSQYVKGIAVANVASITTRKVTDDLNMLAKKFGLKGVTVLKCENGVLTGSFMKFVSEIEATALIKEFELKHDDILILASSDNHHSVNFGLGAIRSQYGRELKLIDEESYDLLWVVNWPLFEYDEEHQTYSSNHHPFTRPNDEHLEYLAKDPRKVYAQAYDLVFNGYEAGGGSLRIYDSKIQKRVFDIIGLTEEEIKNKFGFFIDAFNYGTPPHGGIAFGLDRLAMILANTNNIRDVIAFPKNLSAVCPMSNAPQEVSEAQLKELKIKIE